MSSENECILNKFNNIMNNTKFTIPSRLYLDTEYSRERNLILLLLASILEKNKNFKNLNKSIQDKIIIGIEKSCYDATIKKSNELLIYISWENTKFNYQYQLFCNKITKNLDCESEVNSEYLINKIINNEINISNIANMTSDTLCPDKSDLIKQSIQIRNAQKLNYKTSSLYQCRNCKKRSVTIKTVQLRSLDEGNSLSLTCMFCNFTWVVG
jgi:DNA-directed RNA polymerase subunit M/transcription elongation factor TFIIS